ncbi:MAG: hypothetical protein ABIJ38_00460 [Patescibacteria group bacterium]
MAVTITSQIAEIQGVIPPPGILQAGTTLPTQARTITTAKIEKPQQNRTVQILSSVLISLSP